MHVGLVVVDEEVFDRHNPVSVLGGHHRRRAQGDQSGRRVLVGIAVDQPTADGGHVANPGRCHLAESVGQQRQITPDNGVVLYLALGAKRADQLLERFKLTEKCNAKHRALSGGMKKRLLLCRALIHEPEIMILDEPTAGCDLELRFLIWDYLVQLNKEGKTIFLTTHNMEEAEKLCKTIGIINHGRIVRIGDKNEVLQDKSLEAVFLEVTESE